MNEGDVLTLLRLIKRSPRSVSGWSTVSRTLMNVISKLPYELVDLVKHADGTGHVRLTAAGEERIESARMEKEKYLKAYQAVKMKRG
jgi:hypothetical protein